MLIYKFLYFYSMSNMWICNYYRAMHVSAKRGLAIACRLSVCLSARPSVTLVNCDHIGWNSSKIISRLVSLGCSSLPTHTSRVYSKGNTRKFWPKVTHSLLIWASETFDRKLRPSGYRQRNCHNGEPRKPPSLFRMMLSLTPYDLPFPQNGGSICPQDTRMAISPQRVIRYTSCLVLG